MTAPNRGRKGPAIPPDTIRAARASLGLTQLQASGVALVSLRAWIKYESAERPMPASVWALFRLRARLVTLREIQREG